MKTSSNPSRAFGGVEAAAPQSGWAMSSFIFTAGAVLMSLEIVGSRIMAPYFGNSVFVWGSLITIFLISISVGNYGGGIIADRFPRPVVIAGICMAAALYMVGLAFIAPPICQATIDGGFDNQAGPLISSVVLFLPPSIGLSMVTPFAIRLRTENVEAIGKRAGGIYALSTAGSIAGTLITTFVLIPNVFVSTIVIGVGAVMFVMSIPLFYWSRSALLYIAPGLAIIGGSISLAGELDQPKHIESADAVLVNSNTAYHNILVVDNAKYGYRELKFDQYTESAIELKPPHRGLSDYTNYFNLTLLVNPAPARCLFIGAGGGIGPRVFHDHNPNTIIDVVDIDAEVLRIAKDYFYLEESEAVRLTAEDGRMFLRRSDAKYDIIVLDAFTIGGRIPFHLTTREFFQLCKSRMTDNGVVMINTNSSIEGPKSGIYTGLRATLNSVFGESYAFGVNRRQHTPTSTMNILLMAKSSGAPIPQSAWSEMAAKYESNSYVNRQLVSQMTTDLILATPTTEGVLFTDDFSPIESMPF